MPPVGFEPTISAGERPQTYALERAANGTGSGQNYRTYYIPPFPPLSPLLGPPMRNSPGPKKEWGRRRAPPKKWAHQGQLPIFEFVSIFELESIFCKKWAHKGQLPIFQFESTFEFESIFCKKWAHKGQLPIFEFESIF